MRALTWRTLIGLLAVTGMRTGEACRLDRDDVDLGDGLLTVRDSKFGKHRQVPIHASTVQALESYGRSRDRFMVTAATPAWFVWKTATRRWR